MDPGKIKYTVVFLFDLICVILDRCINANKGDTFRIKPHLFHPLKANLNGRHTIHEDNSPAPWHLLFRELQALCFFSSASEATFDCRDL